MSSEKDHKSEPAERDGAAQPSQPGETNNGECDNVDEASRESFPASDAPAWTVTSKKHNKKRPS